MLKPTILPENVAKELSLAQKSSCKCLGKPFSGQHSLKFIFKSCYIRFPSVLSFGSRTRFSGNPPPDRWIWIDASPSPCSLRLIFLKVLFGNVKLPTESQPPNKKTWGKHRTCWQPVCIVIPAHNEEAELPLTLQTLKQTIETLELTDARIIVANDDSSDATGSIAVAHGCQVVDVKLRNIGAVRNAGANAADSPWLFFLDADTQLPPATLAGALDLLAQGYAGGGAHVSIPEQPKVAWKKLLLYYGVRLLWQCIAGRAAGCFMFCKKRDFDDFGGFDEKFFAAEEWFFSESVAKRGKFGLVREPVVTSARKLHRYSFTDLLRLVTLPILTSRTPLQSQVGLEILYDDAR